MATADIQLYDGYDLSPVLHLDDFGEDAIKMIDGAIENTASVTTRFHITLDRLFGAMIKHVGEYLDSAVSDPLTFTVHQRYRLLRETGRKEPEHFGSFVVLVCPDDPVSTSCTIYSGNLSSEAEKEILRWRALGAAGVGRIEPLKSLNDEVARMEKKQGEWLNSSKKSYRADGMPPSDLWRLREMEQRDALRKGNTNSEGCRAIQAESNREHQNGHV